MTGSRGLTGLGEQHSSSLAKPVGRGYPQAAIGDSTSHEMAAPIGSQKIKTTSAGQPATTSNNQQQTKISKDKQRQAKPAKPAQVWVTELSPGDAAWMAHVWGFNQLAPQTACFFEKTGISGKPAPADQQQATHDGAHGKNGGGS